MGKAFNSYVSVCYRAILVNMDDAAWYKCVFPDWSGVMV